MKITMDNQEYDVIIERKRSNKNTYFRVKEDLNLYVTTNFLVSDKNISRMIDENYQSIVRMYNKQLYKNNLKEKFFYLGREYAVVYTNGNDIYLGGERVFIGRNANIDKWYRKEAETVFKNCLDSCYEQFTRSIPKPTLRIRKMTSRWGVCNTATHVVTLNLELMKRDILCLEYVVMHELSHLIEANHSKRFWSVVEENFPNYREIRRIMRNF